MRPIRAGLSFMPMLLIASPALSQQAGVPVTPPRTATVDQSSSEDYQLGAADKVRIIIFDEANLSGEFIVGAKGALSMPLIGDVYVAGKTTTEAAAAIRGKLIGDYLLEPRVSIDIIEFRPFYILGEVNKPGEYPFSSGLTVDAAVATASGYTYRAEKKKVFIKHTGELLAHREILTPDLKIRPGDTIRIPERYF